jgi:hypothetical protein
MLTYLLLEGDCGWAEVRRLRELLAAYAAGDDGAARADRGGAGVRSTPYWILGTLLKSLLGLHGPH